MAQFPMTSSQRVRINKSKARIIEVVKSQMTSMAVDTISNSCGLSVAAIRTFLEGKNPQVETVLRIADIFDMELKLVKREENA
jgi:DNA-binding phage protein